MNIVHAFLSRYLRLTPLLIVAWLLAIVAPTRSGAQAADTPDSVKPIPPPGITVSAADGAALQAGIDELGHTIDALRTDLRGHADQLALLPDVQIFYNAVRYALTYDEFFNAREITVARDLLRQGMERADALRSGQTPWTTKTGLVVRGYVSRIDGSVQPYGLVIPESWSPTAPHRYRLDIWYHGRGETLSEVNFLNDRERSRGEFAPDNTIVLHPYGRYCNANRFAGEVDTFEALASVEKRYRIDPDRIAVRGFSMGGASCWQFATHYGAEWVAAAPGAGFTETAEFLGIAKGEGPRPSWWERKLWHLYDSVDYAVNLFNCPVVAYSGELDGQKQAADRMADALAKEGIQLEHVIGPGAHHFYEANAKAEVARRIDAIASAGRNPLPRHIRFTTWTLRYPRMGWVHLDGLEHHWTRARVDAEIVGDSGVRLTTQNVTALTLEMPPGLCPLDNTRKPHLVLDGEQVDAPAPLSDRSWTAHFRKRDRQWVAVPAADDGELRKRPGLQGPIDDAFMDSFLMVRPTGSPLNAVTAAWTARELDHAIVHWRRQFRGEAQVRDDSAVTDADIAASNLVLWGDPSSNRVLARIADRLPIRWSATGITVGSQTFAANHYALVMVFPNPLNYKRYVVLNSGFTFREYDYLNNARQSPKLPDWAIIDVTTPPTSRTPGKVVDAGFFDEQWQLDMNRPAQEAER